MGLYLCFTSMPSWLGQGQFGSVCIFTVFPENGGSIFLQCVCMSLDLQQAKLPSTLGRSNGHKLIYQTTVSVYRCLYHSDEWQGNSFCFFKLDLKVCCQNDIKIIAERSQIDSNCALGLTLGSTWDVPQRALSKSNVKGQLGKVKQFFL